jgi:hypothetical protein
MNCVLPKFIPKALIHSGSFKEVIKIKQDFKGSLIPHDGINTLMRRDHRSWLPVSLPCEVTVRRHCRKARKASSETNPDNTLLLDFWPSDHKKINVCCLRHQSVVLCYSSLSTLIKSHISWAPAAHAYYSSYSGG